MRKVEALTPHAKDSIIVPMHDCWFHKQKLMQHFPYPVSVDHTVQISVDKPTLIIEFTREEPDVAEFAKDMVTTSRRRTY